MSKERAGRLVDSGLWLRLTGDLEGARGLFEEALKVDPQNQRAIELLALEPVQTTPPRAPVVGGTVATGGFTVEPLPLSRRAPEVIGPPAQLGALAHRTMILSGFEAPPQAHAAQVAPRPPPLPGRAPSGPSAKAHLSAEPTSPRATLVPFFTDAPMPSAPLPRSTGEPLPFVTETPVPPSSGPSTTRRTVLGSPASAPRLVAPSVPAQRSEPWAPPSVPPLAGLAPAARTTRLFGEAPPAPPDKACPAPQPTRPQPSAGPTTPFGVDQLMQTTTPFGKSEVVAALRAAARDAQDGLRSPMRPEVMPKVIRLDLGDSLPEPKSIVDALRDKVDAKSKTAGGPDDSEY